MNRPKTESELQQEQADEEFARQLQEEFNQPSSPPNSSVAQQIPVDSPQEAADAAFARQLQEQINQQEAAAAANKHHSRRYSEERIEIACPVCTFINHIKPSSSTKHWKCSQCSNPLPNPTAPSHHDEQKDLMECNVCHLLNRLPATKSDAMLCGGCFQALGSSSKAAPLEETENQRTVQLRCGQCNVINAVTISADVKKMEFICGGCGVLNNIVLE